MSGRCGLLSCINIARTKLPNRPSITDEKQKDINMEKSKSQVFPKYKIWWCVKKVVPLQREI